MQLPLDKSAYVACSVISIIKVDNNSPVWEYHSAGGCFTFLSFYHFLSFGEAETTNICIYTILATVQHVDVEKCVQGNTLNRYYEIGST